MGGVRSALKWVPPEPSKGRDDLVTWIDSEDPQDELPKALVSLFRTFEELRHDLGRFVSLRGPVEHQLAWYAKNASGYFKHRDAEPDDGSSDHVRKITAIVYLNPCWRSADGGQLRMWPKGLETGRSVDVEPIGGRA